MFARTSLIVSAILFVTFSRLVPHPWNFAPVTALALFGAATLSRRWLGLLLPLLALLLSDLALESLYRVGWSNRQGLYPGMGAVYGAFLLSGLLGLTLRGRRRVANVAGATLAGSVLFFLITNFAVWADANWAPGTVGYPPTAAGLIACYQAALPFFRGTLLGDAVFSSALFGGLALAERYVPALREPALLPARS